MSKFDRSVFILIGLGIWTLVMTQVFEPKSVIAGNGFGSNRNPCFVEMAKGSELQKKTKFMFAKISCDSDSS